MGMIELNPCFGAANDTLNFWSTITGSLKTSREKKNHTTLWLVTANCWYPNFLKAARQLQHTRADSLSTPSSSQRLHLHLQTSFKHPLPSLNILNSILSIEAIIRWSPPTSLYPPTTTPGSLCNPILFKAHLPSLPWEALLIYLHCTNRVKFSPLPHAFFLSM